MSTISGHLLAIGVTELIEPGMSVDETIDAVHDQGGVAIGDHPFDIKNAGMGDLSRKTDAIEVFNAINMERITKKPFFMIIFRIIKFLSSQIHKFINLLFI